jgi:hypothetical protein
MNIKRIFGALLTVLGICGLIYIVLYINSKSGAHNIKALFTFGILGFIFFIAGIGHIRATKDKNNV